MLNLVMRIGGLTACVLLQSVLLVGGCQRGVVILEEVERAGEGMVRPGPFAPAEMRIHPLTHPETVGDRERIVLHMEVRDGWGDTIKGVGAVTVRLRRAGVSAVGQDEIKWDIDLRDLTKNVSYFDSVTRTYRFVITGLPSWFTEQGTGRLRVDFRTARANGDIFSMHDEFEVVRIASE